MANQKVAARLQVGPNCLLFFIDETGHETFADKNYPVFGLGGCAINSSSAAAVIAEPWRAMKAAHFGGEDIPLHANELRNPTTEQLDALSKFFREQQFARLAVTMSKSAVLPTGKTPLEIITGSMMNRYADLLRRVPGRPPLYMIGVDAAKEVIVARLSIEEPGPGACHFPTDRDLDYFRMLTAERPIRRFRQGVGSPGVDQGRVRPQRSAGRSRLRPCRPSRPTVLWA
jgi:hypothetical protein